MRAPDRAGTRASERGDARGDRDTLRGERGGMRGHANGTREDRAGSRGDLDRFGNGGGSGRGGGRTREHDYRGGGGGGSGGGGGGRGASEPDAKRPRVTSTIVVASGEDDGGGDGPPENGVLDRWNAEPAPTSTVPAASAAAEKTSTAATKDDNANDDDDFDDNVDYEPEPELEAAGEGAGTDAATTDAATTAGTPAVADPDKDEANEGVQAMDEEAGEGEDGEDGGGDARRPVGKIVLVSGGGPRGRAARIGGVAGSGGLRGSLASRLGPPMGRPVMVKDGGDGGGGGGEGGFVPLSERPMPEPSKPELHVAYKDGDTKKRNRRMFGGLMAHLGRARKQLDHDQTLIERQKSVAEMAAIRQAQEKRQHRLAAATAAREERDEELHKRDYINARQQKTLVALHGNAFIANQEQLKGFIFTKTLPKLAWTPNEHSDVTQALLTDSNADLDSRIEGRKEADDREFQKIDDMVAQRAAARASRRSGNAHAAGDRRQQADRRGRDRNANPYGEGNEDRWPTAGGEGARPAAAAGERGGDGKGEGPELSGMRRKRADDTGGGGGGGASPLDDQDNGRDDHMVDDADQPVPDEGAGNGEAAEAEFAAGVAEGDGMEVDGGGETGGERGQRGSSPRDGGSPTPAEVAVPSSRREKRPGFGEDGGGDWSDGEGGRDDGTGDQGGMVKIEVGENDARADGAVASSAARREGRRGSEDRKVEDENDEEAEAAEEEGRKKDKKKKAKKKTRGDRESTAKSDAPREKKKSSRRRSSSDGT
ncbi:unnamed protein product [Scytosiphon promiscuus]